MIAPRTYLHPPSPLTASLCDAVRYVFVYLFSFTNITLSDDDDSAPAPTHGKEKKKYVPSLLAYTLTRDAGAHRTDAQHHTNRTARRYTRGGPVITVSPSPPPGQTDGSWTRTRTRGLEATTRPGLTHRLKKPGEYVFI
jgi:hypothetical protein